MEEISCFHSSAEIARLLFKGRIKRTGGGLEVVAFDCGTGFARPVLPVHAAVLPFDGERSVILNVIERTDDFFKLNIAATN